jgi:hypothetical protein
MTVQKIGVVGTMDAVSPGLQDRESWPGFVFRGDRFRGTSFSENAEGALAWHLVD